ncbi:MAG: hypothetical protein ACJA0N_000737 [Pseudohongiellaceae bacterium]|jgi:hypothetical protein
MNYSNITLNDPNPIKRYLQRSRFTDAVSLLPNSIKTSSTLDFGGGDGELCLQLANKSLESDFI